MEKNAKSIVRSEKDFFIHSNLIFISSVKNLGWGSTRGVMANVLVCNIEFCKFELQLRYTHIFGLIPLGKGMNLLITWAMGSIVPLLFFLQG